MNIYDIYEAVAGSISKRLRIGVTRNGVAQNSEHRITEALEWRTEPANTDGIVALPEVIEHARIVIDYLWRSETADGQFWANLGTNAPHVYDSMVILELWIDQQTARSIPERRTHLSRPIDAIIPAIADAISTVVDYLWDDEQQDFQACSGDRRTNHIFNELAKIARWLDQLNRMDKPGT